jgi:CRISPR-associated endonuclease Csn1
LSYLKEHKFEYKKDNYKNLNVFVEQVQERNFRTEKDESGEKKHKILEHPDLAFSPEELTDMNKPENLIKLNNGKNHMPIKKVRTYTKLGTKHAVSKDDYSNKNMQYVTTDGNSNLYLGVYQRNMNKNEIKTERKFNDIDLLSLIKFLKKNKNNRFAPLPTLYFEGNKEFQLRFTLSPLDIVYVPTEDELKKQNECDPNNNNKTVDESILNFDNLNAKQLNRIYKYVDGSSKVANFIPFSVSDLIWKFHKDKDRKVISEKSNIEIDKFKNEYGLRSPQSKNQNSIDGIQIKSVCWKLEVDRLGNIKKIIK